MHKNLTNKPPASSFAYLLLAILIFNVFAQSLQYADAQLQPVKISGLGDNILEVHYQESSGILWALGGSRTVSDFAFLYEINPVNNTVTTIYNMTDFTNGGAPIDLWCGVTNCFITTRTAIGIAPSATIGSIIRIETSDIGPKGTVSGQFNATNDERGFGVMDGRDSTATGIGGISLFVESYTSTGNAKVIIVGAVGTMAISNANFQATSLSGTDQTINDIVWSGIASDADRNHLLMLLPQTAGSTTQFINVRSLANNTQFCAEGYSITANQDGGQILFDYSGNTPYVFAPTGNDGEYIRVDTSQILGANCPIINPYITTTNTGLSGSVTQKNGIQLPARDLFFFQESGTNARIGFADYNFDTQEIGDNSLVVEITPNNSQPSRYGRAYYAIEHDVNGQKLFSNQATIGTGSSAFNAIFIPMDADESIFVWRFQAPVAPVTPTTPTLPENNIAELTGFIFCIGGFINALECDPETGFPSNTDPKTNGTGIAVLGFFVIISYAFIVYIHFSAQRNLAKQNVQLVQVMAINPVLLLFMLIVDVGIVWYFGFIEDMIFFGIMTLLIGLAGFGIYKQVKS